MTTGYFLLSVGAAIGFDGAYAVLAGLLLAHFWLAYSGFAHSGLSGKDTVAADFASIPISWRPLLIGFAFLLALAQAFRPWLLAVGMSGLTAWKDVAPLIPEILNTTHMGRLWYIDSAAIVFLLAAIVVLLRGPDFEAGLAQRNFRSTSGYLCAGAALVVIGSVKAASGHAGADGDFTFREAVQALHILATAVWAGGILVSGFLVLPRIIRFGGHGPAGIYGEKLSETATTAIIVVLASGVYTADRELNNSLSGLWNSSWGVVLIAKIVCVLMALGLGAYNRFQALPEAVSGKPRAFEKTVMAEAVMMIAILCLSGVLGTLAPG